MSFFRASFGIVGKSDGGSAKRRSAYQRCTNSDGFDFSAKSDEFVHNEIMLPPNAPAEFADSSKLWNAVEAAEKRCDAQLSRTIEIAIPHEVPEELRNDFAREILQPYVERGFGLEWTRHKAEHLFSDTINDTSTENDHVHVQMTLRTIASSGLDAKKDRDFNTYMRTRNGRQAREDIAERMNIFFQKNGITAEVDAGPKNETVEDIPKKIIQQIKRVKDDNRNKEIPEHLRKYFRDRATKYIKNRGFRNEQEKTGVNKHIKGNIPTNSKTDYSGGKEKSAADTRDQRQIDRPIKSTPAGGLNRGTEQDRGTTGTNSSIQREYRSTTNGNREQSTRNSRSLSEIRNVIAHNKLKKAGNKFSVYSDNLKAIADVPPTDFPTLTTDDVNNFLKKWSQSTKIGMRM